LRLTLIIICHTDIAFVKLFKGPGKQLLSSLLKPVVHVEQGVRNLSINVALSVRVARLSDSEAERRLRDHDDLKRELSVARQILERHVVKVFLAIFFSVGQRLEVQLLAHEVDVLSE
jgi:hypothetical protein